MPSYLQSLPWLGLPSVASVISVLLLLLSCALTLCAVHHTSNRSCRTSRPSQDSFGQRSKLDSSDYSLSDVEGAPVQTCLTIDVELSPKPQPNTPGSNSTRRSLILANGGQIISGSPSGRTPTKQTTMVRDPYGQEVPPFQPAQRFAISEEDQMAMSLDSMTLSTPTHNYRDETPRTRTNRNTPITKQIRDQPVFRQLFPDLRVPLEKPRRRAQYVEIAETARTSTSQSTQTDTRPPHPSGLTYQKRHNMKRAEAYRKKLNPISTSSASATASLQAQLSFYNRPTPAQHSSKNPAPPSMRTGPSPMNVVSPRKW
jgi:hypothetical protein